MPKVIGLSVAVVEFIKTEGYVQLGEAVSESRPD